MLRSLFENNEEKAGKKKTRVFWIYAMGEFVLVFLGILIALQVDNWNQRRQEKKLERVLLTEMLTDLRADLEDIDFNTYAHNRFLHASQVVLEFMNSDLPWHDSLGGYFALLMGGSIFDINTSAYESLKSIGIDLVRNDRLRQKITALYSTRYNHVRANQELLFNFVFDHLYPSLRSRLHTVRMRQMTVPVNLGDLRQDNAFLEDLEMAVFTYQLSIRIFQEARESIVDLISEIELELGIEPGE